MRQETEQSRRLETTDRQIDQFVYALYGLTDAKTKTVEDAPAGQA